MQLRKLAFVVALFTSGSLLGTACTPSGTQPGASSVPSSGQPSGASLADQAKAEGKVVVYSTTDSASVQPLLADFRAAVPGVKVEYNDLNSTEVYNRFTSEAAAGAQS